jgi:hypothetical protein
LTIPIDDYLLLVSMDRSSNHIELMKKILDIVRKLTK